MKLYGEYTSKPGSQFHEYFSEIDSAVTLWKLTQPDLKCSRWNKFVEECSHYSFKVKTCLDRGCS